MATPRQKRNHAKPELEDTSRIPQMLRALRHRNFQLFFSGQLISLVGTWMDNIAEAWLVYRLTGSSLLLGTVAFAGQIPVFLLAPIGGMVADRWNRHRVVIATQAISMVLAGILAVLTLSHRITVWEVVVLAALMGAVNAFDIPARQAFLVDMVGREDLMNAIALNSSMFNGARVIGPSIAGILVASLGEGWCFAANSISYIAVIIGLLLMHVNRAPVEVRRVSPFEHIVEGFRFVWNTGPIRALLLLLGLVSLAAMPLATRSGVKGLGRWVAVACASFGTFLILFSLSRWYVLSVVLLIPVGFAMMVQMASSNTLIQAMVPDRLRGRAMAVYSMMFMGMAPMGALLSGWSADHIGAQWTLTIGGVGAIIGAALFALNLPKIRVEARELIIAQGMAGGEPAQEVTARSAP